MLLSSIVNNLEFQQIKGSLEVEINAITYDSREATPDPSLLRLRDSRVRPLLYLQSD